MAPESSLEPAIEMTSPPASTREAPSPASTSSTAGEISHNHPVNGQGISSNQSYIDRSRTTPKTRRVRRFSSSISNSNSHAAPCPNCCTGAQHNEAVQGSHRQHTIWTRITDWLWEKGSLILTAILSAFSGVFAALQFLVQRDPAPPNLTSTERWRDNLLYWESCNELKKQGQDLDQHCQERLAKPLVPPPESSSSSSKEKRGIPPSGSGQQWSFTQIYSSCILGPLTKLRHTIDEAKKKLLNEIGGMRELQAFLNNPERYVGGGAVIPRRRW